MADKPIIFSGPMVRALLEGRKTQTRRVIKDRGDLPEFCGGRFDARNDPAAWGWEDCDRGEWITLDQWRHWTFVPYRIGDHLWVREAHYLTDDGESEYAVFAEDEASVKEHFADMQATMASHPSIDWSKHLRKRPSIHMPRWASRLTLTVTDVRVQRLQEISSRDVLAEGVEPDRDVLRSIPNRMYRAGKQHDYHLAHTIPFRDLWNSLHGPGAWEQNPWVVALTFDVHRCNIDQMESNND